MSNNPHLEVIKLAHRVLTDVNQKVDARVVHKCIKDAVDAMLSDEDATESFAQLYEIYSLLQIQKALVANSDLTKRTGMQLAGRLNPSIDLLQRLWEELSAECEQFCANPPLPCRPDFSAQPVKASLELLKKALQFIQRHESRFKDQQKSAADLQASYDAAILTPIERLKLMSNISSQSASIERTNFQLKTAYAIAKGAGCALTGKSFDLPYAPIGMSLLEYWKTLTTPQQRIETTEPRLLLTYK